MENVFLHLLNMSLTAAVLVVVVLLLRLVFHKAPRWIHCLLWALVAVRLLCPFAIESDLSLMPSTPVVTVPDSLTLSDPVITPQPPATDSILPDAPSTPVPPQTSIGGTVTSPVAPTVPDSSVAAPGDSVDPWQVVLTVATYVWLLGVLVMAAYAIVTTLRLRHQVREAACLEGNIWQCDHLRTPFILGVLRPRIYLPSDLNGTVKESVVAHEKAHLRRLDHLWKPLGFLLLTVYWFNPILWIAYAFLCRDIEAACDEQVVQNMTAADRKAYSEALLACSAPRRLISACPLAFGETSVKSRIKSVLSYKKPTIWIIVAALLVSTVAGVCLLTDRPVAQQEPDDPPSATDEDDTPDTAKTAPVGLTHVIRAGLDDEDLEQYFGSSGVQQFHSKEELLAFLTSCQEGDQEWLGVQWEVGDFDQFDDAFFADNVLLLTHHTTSSGMFTPEVVGYTYSEDGAVLTVEFVEYHPGFATDDIGNWLMFSGINKTDLEGVTALKSHFSKAIPTDTYVAAFTEHTEYPDKATEKWRHWLPSDESWALNVLLNEWDEAGRWGDSQSVDRALTFAAAFQLHGHIHYLATDYSALLRDDGTLLWLNEAEGAFLRWIAAYYDEENEEILYLASSHPTSYDRRYAAVPVVLNSPELKAVVNSNRWETAFGDVSTYARFTLGGTVYHIDRNRERIVYANDNNTALYAVYLTAEELAFVDTLLASSVWAHTDYMVGKVTQVSTEDDSVTMKITDSSKYTADISDGTEIRVSLRYYVGEVPAVGSGMRVTYDGYLGSYYDGERYHPLIHAHSVTITAQSTGTKPTTTKPTTTAKPTTKPTASADLSAAQVTFVKFSRPLTQPQASGNAVHYMYPVQPDAATCVWLRRLAMRTDWVKNSNAAGAYDAYFTMGSDEDYYYVDRVNQKIYHDNSVLSLSNEEVGKLDVLIRSYGIQNNAPLTATTADWKYLTGRVLEYVDGEDGYILLDVDLWWIQFYGETVKVSTRFIPQRYYSVGKTVCVVYDGEADVKTSPYTFYAGAVHALNEDSIITTGVPQYDNLLKQIQDYFYKRSDVRPSCSPAVWNCQELSDVGVKLIDLDRNGQDELVIGATNSTFWIGYSDVYTIRDGQLVQLFQSNDNLLYSIHKGGYVCKEWTKYTLAFGEDYYRIEGGQLVFLEGLTFDIDYAASLDYEGVDAWFRVTMQDGKKTYEHITEAEANAIADKYGKNDLSYNISVIPFSL